MLYKGTDWADRLVPSTEEGPSYIEFTALLSIGLTLLGYYFIVFGFTGLVGGLTSVALAEDYGREWAWRKLASSIAMLLSGMVLAAMGRRSG